MSGIARQRRYLEEENRRYPSRCVEVPAAQWPPALPPRIAAVWRSRRFLVQVFAEPAGVMRLTVIRTALDHDGRFVDGIRWEELQQVKMECGFGHCDAVEFYPADQDVVDVQNMRHLWVLPERHPLVWRASDAEGRA